ncbi:hypothetical protein V1515DRAFT_582895 [Lipomyces mesembrius]
MPSKLFSDFQNFLEYSFGGPDARTTAEQELLNLRQGNMSCTQYFPDSPEKSYYSCSASQSFLDRISASNCLRLHPVLSLFARRLYSPRLRLRQPFGTPQTLMPFTEWELGSGRKNRRRQQGLCLYFGNPGHSTNVRPTKKNQPTTRPPISAHSVEISVGPPADSTPIYLVLFAVGKPGRSAVGGRPLERSHNGPNHNKVNRRQS